jgi:hypothetical protein
MLGKSTECNSLQGKKPKFYAPKKRPVKLAALSESKKLIDRRTEESLSL